MAVRTLSMWQDMKTSTLQRRKIFWFRSGAWLVFLIGWLQIFPPHVFWQPTLSKLNVELRNVNNTVELKRIIEDETAVIFLYVDWSVTVQIMRWRIQDILRQAGAEWSERGVSFYQIDVTEADEFIPVLERLLALDDLPFGGLRGGYGTVFWIKDKRVVDWEQSPIAIDDKELIDRTWRLVR